MIRDRERWVSLGQVQVTKTRLCPQGTLHAKQAKVGVGSGGPWRVVGMEFPLSPMECVTRKELTQFWALPASVAWFGLFFLF